MDGASGARLPGRSHIPLRALIMLTLVLFAPLADASWFQTGSDAARTGVTSEPGPRYGDTAFVANLPGSVIGNIAIDGGWIYAVTSEFGHPGGRSAVWRIASQTGVVEHLFELPERASRYGVHAFDAERLFLFDGQTLIGWERDTGKEVGKWLVPLVADEENVWCAEPTMHEGTLYFACTAQPVPDSLLLNDTVADPTARAPDGPANLIVAALDPETLEPLWTAEPQLTEGLGVDPDRPDRLPGGRAPTHVSLSVGADRVFLYTSTGFHHTYSDDPEIVANHNEFLVWSLGINDGTVEWTRYGEQSQGFRAADLPPGSDLRSPDALLVGGLPLVGPEALYLRMDTIQAINIATGSTIWSEEVGQADSIDVPGASGLGLSGNALLASSLQSAYRLDASTGAPLWESRLPAGSQTAYVSWPVTTDGERAFFEIFACGAGRLMRGVRTLDMQSGELQWERQYTETYPDLPFTCWATGPSAHAERLIATGFWDGRLIVLGETEASLRVPDIPPVAYPAVGSTVLVDLSGTTAGIDGPATRFMAEWGDGTTTEWQENPRLTHIYNGSGERTARFVAANDNQTSTAAVTYHVGGTPPREPNLVETMFARENQDLTFGILGILVALAGGLIAVIVRRHKRGILQRELDAIDRAYHATQSDPVACDATLVERQAHCHGMLVDGSLDETQYAILKGRIEELARGVRLSTLDHQFQFLPHGMVLALRDMLADGRISSWERDHVLRALQEDTILTKSQKTKVRRLIDEWFEQDSGSTRGDRGI